MLDDIDGPHWPRERPTLPRAPWWIRQVRRVLQTHSASNVSARRRHDLCRTLVRGTSWMRGDY
jgi:hypothetical protein